MSEELMLSVKDLNITFNDHKIIDNLSFDIKRDSIVAVVGPNGAGKTVLFRSILGLISCQGNVKWHNDARIGYVPQKLTIEKDLPITVMEFLKLKEDDEKKIKDILTRVGFRFKSEHIHHDIRVLNTRLGSLSGGELQRILIAYALLKDPNVLLLDEPTAGVDILGEQKFYELFEELRKDSDLTIIFISHDKEIIDKYAEDKIILNNDH